MMLGNSKEGLQLVCLNHVNDTNISNGLVEISWEMMIELLKSHDIRDNKEGPCFIPAIFKASDQWTLTDNDKNPSYRHDGNVEGISVAVLDLDEPGSKEKAEEAFKDFEHVIYSTHSYTADTPYKFRIVLRLDGPIKNEDWPENFKSLIAPIDADRSCGNLSRVFYLPSHSPKAGIAPYFQHNEGQSLSVEHINKIRDDYLSGLTAEELKEFKERNAPTSKGKGIRTHFTGETRNINDYKNLSIDYSYEGMKKSFAKFIPELDINDNRHDFALKVCGSAIGRWGDKTDFFNLVQFIYKASTEYGSKPITDPTGDTRKEIPEMISSAISKYAPESIKDRVHYSEIRGLMKGIVADVERMAITGSWDFPTEVVSYSDIDFINGKVDKKLNGDIDYSRNAMRDRNIAIIKGFVRGEKLAPFMKKLFENEYALSGEKMNINAVGQFAFYCIRGHATQVLATKNLNKTLEVASSLLAENYENIVPHKMQNEANRSFYNASIKIGHKRALQEKFKWGLPHDDAKSEAINNKKVAPESAPASAPQEREAQSYPEMNM